MPGPATYNVPWSNQNAQRRYPLAGDATGTDRTGSFTLPDDFLVGLDLPVAWGADVDPGRFFVMAVGAYATGYALVVGYQPQAGGAAVQVANALCARGPFVRNQTLALGGVGTFADSMGKVTLGSLALIDRQPPGYWEFDFAATRLEPDAIRPEIRGISALVCVNGDQRSVPLQGIVEIRAGGNCQLVPVLVDGQDPAIVVNFLEGAGTVSPCVCTGDAAPTPPITRIDGIVPTAGGDFSILGSQCVEVTAVTNGIRLTNACAAPCCSCTELKAITQDLQRLMQEKAAVQAFVQALQASSTTFDLTVLGSKLGDQPDACVRCT